MNTFTLKAFLEDESDDDDDDTINLNIKYW